MSVLKRSLTLASMPELQTSWSPRHLMHSQQEFALGKHVAQLREHETMANRALMMWWPGSCEIRRAPKSSAAWTWANTQN